MTLATLIWRRRVTLLQVSSEELLERLPDACVVVTREGEIVRVTAELEYLSGYARAELLGRNIEMLVPESLRKAHRTRRSVFAKHPANRPMAVALATQLRQASGRLVDVEITLGVVEQVSEPPLIVAVVRDMTERRRLEGESRRQERRFQEAFDTNNSQMWITSIDGHVLHANQAFLAMMEVTQEEVTGSVFTSLTVPEDVQRVERVYGDLLSSRSSDITYTLRCTSRTGAIRTLDVRTTSVRDDDGDVDYFISSGRDVTEELRLEAELRFQSQHDSLTGLPNRNLFLDQLKETCARVRPQGSPAVIMMMDLDNFQHVNDAFGHAMGDSLIVESARRLQSVVRTSDTLCRVGGDEFLFLRESLAGPEEAIALARRMDDAFTYPFLLGDTFVYQRISIGLRVWNHPTTEHLDLVREVEEAMYDVKRDRRRPQRIGVYHPSMGEETWSRYSLMHDLRQALHDGTVTMHYQPIVSLVSKRIVGFEALMRWPHPTKGFISPETFVPIAEESDLSHLLAEVALRQALREAATWSSVGDWRAQCYVSVNLSANQFRSDTLIPLIQGLMEEYEVTPDRLLIEITESVTLSSVDDTLAVLANLRDLSVQVALDDFGTGYTSLSYLSLINPKIIKIDKSFVSSIITDDTTILESILYLGQRLGVEMLAEGIETLEQYKFLQELGCHLGQGFLFSPARAGSDLETLNIELQELLK